jgi:hypothetical protein
VAVLAHSATVDRLVEAIKPFHPTVIQTSLTRDHEEELVRALLGGGDRVDVVVGDAEASHERLIEDPGAAGGDGPHGQRFMTGDAELAHQQHLQGRVEQRGHLEPDRDAPAWPSQDNHLGLVDVMGQPLSQYASRLGAILKKASSSFIMHGHLLASSQPPAGTTAVRATNGPERRPRPLLLCPRSAAQGV